ncbi:hypothetical protein DFA_03488 [Cavenderia fasciculata]|uniref:GAF domain-containing protein n=1 Tax=Cavenderia fasciculata TaxID=261658 RepID=F4PHQ6_CACFS|nr:uncharacterized protein DFA_03488 [Cavenderia fasciculata]EGG25240.1 hypothetical protein DFA_03488 [Cavenderia fasciculata]|eukprot:XP_004363091.1 hypothetical protein DFA_03488 [Cavenderia fasciculata]
MEEYINKTKLDKYITKEDIQQHDQSRINKWYNEIIDHKTDVIDNQDSLYNITVPKLGDGGTCSLKHEQETFNLETVIGKRSDQLSIIISKLYKIVQQISNDTGSDWFGIYKTYSVDNDKALIKLAYQGEISRPIFPLTDDFALISNNSTVGMTGTGRIITSLQEYDGPYYNCSDKVKSELCIPIFSATNANQVIGIIDAESWKDKHFTPTLILDIATVALLLSNTLSSF